MGIIKNRIVKLNRVLNHFLLYTLSAFIIFSLFWEDTYEIPNWIHFIFWFIIGACFGAKSIIVVLSKGKHNLINLN
jgi:uncharacterized membrane protein AbrB (regulator of aidB expression)